MPKNVALSIISTLTLVVLLGPVVVQAQLVPCNGPDCGFDDLILLAQRIINFLIFSVAAPLAAISFAVAGFLYMTAKGNEAQHSKAKSIFVYVFIGFVIALSAWLIVNFIVTSLVNPAVFDPTDYLNP